MSNAQPYAALTHLGEKVHMTYSKIRHLCGCECPKLPLAPRAPNAELSTTLGAPSTRCENRTHDALYVFTQMLTGPGPAVRLCCHFPTTEPRLRSPHENVLHRVTGLHTASSPTELGLSTSTPAERRERYSQSPRETARPCAHTRACTTTTHRLMALQVQFLSCSLGPVRILWTPVAATHGGKTSKQRTTGVPEAPGAHQQAEVRHVSEGAGLKGPLSLAPSTASLQMQPLVSPKATPGFATRDRRRLSFWVPNPTVPGQGSAQVRLGSLGRGAYCLQDHEAVNVHCLSHSACVVLALVVLAH